jgi:hypothetical protein
MWSGGKIFFTTLYADSRATIRHSTGASQPSLPRCSIGLSMVFWRLCQTAVILRAIYLVLAADSRNPAMRASIADAPPA